MLGADVFQLVRIHIESRDDDHVLNAIDNLNVAIGLNDRDVTRRKPTLRIKYIRCRLGTLPVTLHYLRTLNAQLSGLAKAQGFTCVTYRFNVSLWHRNTNRTQLTTIARFVVAVGEVSVNP